MRRDLPPFSIGDLYCRTEEGHILEADISFYNPSEAQHGALFALSQIHCQSSYYQNMRSDRLECQVRVLDVEGRELLDPLVLYHTEVMLGRFDAFGLRSAVEEDRTYSGRVERGE